MGENILIDTETFEEFPDKYLQVKKNSNYYYIKMGQDSYITRRNLDLVSYDGDGDIKVEIGYYDIFNNRLIVKSHSLDNNPKDFVSLQFSEVLNIKENGVYNFTKEDVNSLLGFTQEKTRYKTYLHK